GSRATPTPACTTSPTASGTTRPTRSSTSSPPRTPRPLASPAPVAAPRPTRPPRRTRSEHASQGPPRHPARARGVGEELRPARRQQVHLPGEPRGQQDRDQDRGREGL